jgi:PEP-CTERM motif
MRCFWSLLAVGLLALPASAITVDGTVDPSYGSPIVVQTTNTQFGDAQPPGALGGSELDAAYAKIEGGRLYLMLTGNHEPNFNKLDIFIDSVPGGENTLSGTPDYDFNGGGGWISTNLQGLTFDTGFEADYHLFSRWGSGTDPYEADFVNRQGGGSAMIPGSTGATPNAVGLIASGSILAGSLGPNASGTALSQNLDFAINDNNAGGVTGDNSMAAGLPSPPGTPPAGVTTGMEFSIALADLGNPSFGTTIRIAAMINNGDHNFLSNQILGPLAEGTGNLGGDGGGGFTGNLAGVNFNQFAGQQYFEIRAVPEPTSVALALLALCSIGTTVRRRASF